MRGPRFLFAVLESKCGDAMSQTFVKLWTCPNCAFSFDALHDDGKGHYDCPVCSEHRLRALVVEYRAALDDIGTPAGDDPNDSTSATAVQLRAALAKAKEIS